MRSDEIRVRDPYVFTENGKYYLYGTEGAEGKKFNVYISTDLENWEVKEIFSPMEGFWGTKQFWAPELHKYRGKYYLFASFCADGECHGTHVLVCDTPDGRFLPLTKDRITPPDQQCIDGTLYVDEKGIPYMAYSHMHTQCVDGEMCLVQLSEDLTKTVGETKVLFYGSELKGVRKIGIEGIDNCGYVVDGPEIYKIDGKLYMFWANFKEEYVQAVAVSDNGKIEGPWRIEDDVIYSADGGHGMMFTTFEGKNKFVLHTPNNFGTEYIKFFDIVFENEKFSLI